jgi:hypothetical protein
MPSYCSPRGCLLFEQALAPFLAEEGLPFASVLPAETIAQAFAEEGVGFGTTKNSVFTPALTLWAFLSQVVHEAKSCHAAVLRVAALLIALARTPCSEDTAAYCRARAKGTRPFWHRHSLTHGPPAAANLGCSDRSFLDWLRRMKVHHDDASRNRNQL